MTTAVHPVYLEQCLHEGLTTRWPETAMPIKVYIAPFHWYEKSKQQESYAYHQMILDAMQVWQQATQDRVRFQVVRELRQSQIDISWRRVDRKSLGHCKYLINNLNQLYSAEIEIGISDGILHAQYNDADEVKHTVIHEMGHALGLIGHSDHAADIMYVPHQYGVSAVSPRDQETIRRLYELPVAFNYVAIGQKYQLKEPFGFNDVMDVLFYPNRIKTNKTSANPAASASSGHQPTPVQSKHQENPAVLMAQHDILTQMGKFHLSTQNIQVNQDLKRGFIEKKILPSEGEVE